MNKCFECSCENSINSDGYCRECGQYQDIIVLSLQDVKHWPSNTWFQKRRATLLKREYDELSKVQS